MGSLRGFEVKIRATVRALPGGLIPDEAAAAQHDSPRVQVFLQAFGKGRHAPQDFRDVLGTAGRADARFALVLKALVTGLFGHYLRLLPHALDAFDDFGFIKLD